MTSLPAPLATALHRHLSIAAAALLMLAPMAAARAELMLNPTRVVFAKNARAAQVELINNGTEAATYRIALVNRRMTDSGGFATVTEPGPGELFADTMLSFSPRQVTLQPGTAQVVRLMVRRPEMLAPGEYRSHLHFEKLAPAKGAPGTGAQNKPEQQGEQGEQGQQGKQIGVVLNSMIGASIPVIVRHATEGAKAGLARLAVTAPAPGRPPMLAFEIERAGDSSVYGDLSVTLAVPGKPDLVLAKVGGVAVYAPNPVRRASLSLNLPEGATLARGSLRLAYRERPEAGARLLAEAVLALP